MSQCLIVFDPAGRVLLQSSKKTLPFNDLVQGLVNEQCTELHPDFFTHSANNRRFYALSANGVYAAVYFDAVTSIDRDNIKSALESALSDRSDLEAILSRLVKLAPKPAEEKQEPREKQEPEKNPKKGKKMRKWVNGELIESTTTDLDYSAKDNGEQTQHNDQTHVVAVDNSVFERKNDLVLVGELKSDPAELGFFSKITSFFGGSAPTSDVSKKFHEQLVAKNVSPATAEAILAKVAAKTGKSVTVPHFRKLLTDELTKILTPNVSTDLLHDIKRSSGPFVVSIVGVNGVGKSTNLAKLAYWLLQNNLDVLICACDTFRSGAVEQLKVHVSNLKRLNASGRIELFEKGYGGGDHVVNTAKAAIQHAKSEGFQVVLIDTAGRTHSNAKLMAPLKKFGDAANPDRIIMVGEALVGTDSVEQATNFNNAFGNRRRLDFFIISKVDTVGDMMGAMINMVVATNVPVLFVGTGQTYTDVKKLSVGSVVDSLMR